MTTSGRIRSASARTRDASAQRSRRAPNGGGQVDPGGAVVRERTVAAGDRDVNVVAQGRQTARDGGHMDRSADAARHLLIGGDVEDGHASSDGTSFTPVFPAAWRRVRSNVASGRSSRMARSR